MHEAAEIYEQEVADIGEPADQGGEGEPCRVGPPDERASNEREETAPEQVAPVLIDQRIGRCGIKVSAVWAGVFGGIRRSGGSGYPCYAVSLTSQGALGGVMRCRARPEVVEARASAVSAEGHSRTGN